MYANIRRSLSCSRDDGIFPDSQWCLTASCDNTAKVWDAHTGKERFTLRGHTDGVTGANFSNDGSWILTSGRDGTARIWDANNDRELLRLGEQSDWIRAAKFSPDGTRILTGTLSPSDALHLWDTHTGQDLYRLPGLASSPWAIDFSADSSRALTVNVHVSDSALYWEEKTGRKTERLTDSPRDDDAAHIWNVAEGRELLSAANSSTHTKNIACFSPDGTRFFTDIGEEAALCSAEDGHALFYVSNFSDIEASHFIAACFSPDGTRILTGNDRGEVNTWDANTGERLLSLAAERNPQYPDFPGSASCVAYSPVGDLILACGSSPNVAVWNALDGQKHLTLTGHTDNVYWAAFSPDGKRVLTGGRDGTARIWRL